MNIATIFAFITSIAINTLPAVTWRDIAKGVEYAAVPLNPKYAPGEGVLHIVRIDPAKARVRALAASEVGGKARTARQWRDDFKLIAVINAGMYQGDFTTHTGFFRLGEHVNSSKWINNYQSIFVLGPRKANLPFANIIDATSGSTSAAYDNYEAVIQNLRLIRNPGVNVWSQNGRQWSEAAIAIDHEGRILFIFCRPAFSMNNLNNLLLAFSLGITRAMHVEGGPEASLSLHAAGIDLDLSGSFETGFNENYDNQMQWPIPNIIGVDAEP